MSPKLPATTWAPPPGASDDRLAFLAIQPMLYALSRPWWARLFRLVEAGAGSSVIGDRGMAKVPNGGLLMKQSMTAEMSGDSVASYVVACDRLSAGLTAPQREELRRSGALPDGFVEQLTKDAREIRKQWRRS